MATATNTTLGEIRLAGDLAGNNNGLAPALTNTGVTAGSYSLPSLTVDGKGRITSISSTSVSSLIPTATSSTLGTVKPDNTSISINGSGVLSSIIPVATNSTLGILRPNDNSITVTAGVLTAVTATSSIRGLVRPDGTTTTVDGTGIISATLPTATAGVPGLVKPDGVTIVMGAGAGVLQATGTVATATSSTLGIVKPDNTSITIDGSGVITSTATAPPTATSTVLGVARPDNTTMTVSSGVLTATAPPTATSTVLGVARPDNTTMTVSAGILSATGPVATSSALGIVKPDNTTMTVSSGILTAVYPTATSSVLGISRPDNTSITVTGGVLSAATVGPATTSTLGRVIVGTNINVSSGTISVPNATTSTLGVARGDGTTITGNSVLSVASSITAAATTSTLGRVIVGTNLTVAGDGTISVPTATSGVLGVVRVDNASIIASSGVIYTSPNIPKLNTQNTWEKAQASAPFGTSVAAGSTTALVGDESNFYRYYVAPTAGTTNTIFTMSTPVDGRKYTFVLSVENNGASLSGDTATIFGKSVTLSSYGYYILEFVVITKPDTSVVVVNSNSLWFTGL